MREAKLAELLEPAIQSLDCELWGLEYLQQGRHGLLRVYIERPETGVTVDDCERVSRQVSSVLDVEDPISGAYTLEVSSPGLDRRLFTLEQCADYVGEQLKVRLRANFDGRRNFSGVLAEIEDGQLVIRSGEDQYTFPFETVERATVVPRFD